MRYLYLEEACLWPSNRTLSYCIFEFDVEAFGYNYIPLIQPTWIQSPA